MRYAFPAIVEQEQGAYGAYFPDLPGCGTTGDTLEQLADMAREVLELHLSGMIEDGEPIPAPTPMNALPRDTEVNIVGAILVSATPGGQSEVTLALPEQTLRRADEVAQAKGLTRERMLVDGLERLLKAS